MVAILEKYKHNVDFHQIVDFVEASHIRIKTTDEGTKIFTTVNGKTRTISESSIRINLKLNDEAGISSLPDAELFENLSLMGPKSKGFHEFSSNIATAVAQRSSPTAPSSPPLLPATTEIIPTVKPIASPYLGYDSQGEARPTVTGLEARQDIENIIKTSSLPYDSTPRVTSLAADEGNMQHQLTELTDLYTRLQRQQTEMATKIATQDLEIASLKARIKILEDKDVKGVKPSGQNATIKGRSLETGEEAGVERSTKRGSNDTEELVSVLTSLDAVSILTRGVQVVSVPPAAKVTTISVPTGSCLVPTASIIFTTASVATLYSRRKGKEKMVELEMPKKKRIQEQIDVQIARELEEEMARDAQRMNEQMERDVELVRTHAEEELQMLIDGLHRKKGKRMKRKGLRLEQESPKKMKTSEKVSEEGLKEMMELVPVEEVYVEAIQTLVRETLSIRQATSDKEKELWLELKRLYEPNVEDQLWTHT
nr:hypothetical protein [Tanacetum cinerariifolium]